METLLLQAERVFNEDSWSWVLSDVTGAFLADQIVALKPTSFEYQGFVDLLGYLAWHATPDRREASEAQLLRRLGDWLGSNLFGAVGQAIAAHRPACVRVLLPAELEFLLHRPLGLAMVDGVPLAERTSLVFDMARYGEDARRRPKGPVIDRLRMLAVFSLPTASSAGSLRRERYELSRLIREIGTRFQAAVELRVLQYGVTRDRLESVLEEGAGWDIIHLSGHGIATGSGFILEHGDGSADVLTADELTSLLRRGRSQLKLVVISHNQSSAVGMAERRRYLGVGEFPVPELADPSLSGFPERAGSGEPPGRPISGTPLSELALKLATRLECAILATRYPLAEETTLRFNDRFYRGLFERRENVVSAMSAALTAVDDASPAARLLAAASPVLIGARAAGLSLAPPRQAMPRMYDPAVRLAYFPGEPDRFVGRDSAMARASAALAPDSGYRGVLFHGLAGGGKSACALELAYRHADVFQQLLWWQAPAAANDTAALASLGTSLEAQLTGFSFRTLLGDTDSYQRQLRDLTALLEELAVLMVLDGLDTLLSDTGEWRDPRWNELVGSLAGQQGLSRVILTSRIPPKADGRILTLPIHTLPLDDTITLAEELPNLRALLHASADPLDGGTDEGGSAIQRDRELVRRVLNVVQGSPKLLELADAAAANPEQLDAQLTALAATTSGHAREEFFRSGISALDAEQFSAALTKWTTAALNVLSPPAKLLAQFLACLEDDDRLSVVLEMNWTGLWERLGRPGDPPDLAPLLDSLTRATLIQRDTPAEAADGPRPAATTYRMHPGVAAAIQAATSPEIRDVADTELAIFWMNVARTAERAGDEDSSVIVRAGLAAAPYLLRRHEWDTASALLENVIVRAESPGTIAAALPALQEIADATQAPKDYAVLASALTTERPAEAEQLMRAALRAADRADDYRLASSIARDLANVLRDTGRLREALELIDQQAAYTQRAGLGPWTQLADQGQRLQILGLMGEHRQVLAETSKLRARMAGLPTGPADDEAVQPWNVREAILYTAWFAALALGEWQSCLDLSAERLASQRQRGAGAHETARTQASDAAPLIRLGRLDEAGRLLLACQQVFEDFADLASLATVLSDRADLEGRRGHGVAAVDLARTALRLRYARPDPRDIAIGHHNLASRLRVAGADPAGQRAHRLAAALVFRVAGMTHDLASAQRALASELPAAPADTTLPATVMDVVRVAEETDGVRLGELLTALEPDIGVVEDALAEVLRAAAELPPETDVAQWDPVIVAMAAASRGDKQAAIELLSFLDELAEQPDWAALARALRRVLDGDRDREELTAGLNIVHSAIVDRTLNVIADRIQLMPVVDEQWLPIVAEIVAAASGRWEASPDLNRVLEQLAATSDWTALVTVLRRILAGERDPGRLTAGVRGMDGTDNAIVEHVLAGLHGADSEQLKAWRAYGVAERAGRSADEII